MLLSDIITKSWRKISVFRISMPRKPRRSAQFPRNSSHLTCRSVEFAAGSTTYYVKCNCGLEIPNFPCRICRCRGSGILRKLLTT